MKLDSFSKYYFGEFEIRYCGKSHDVCLPKIDEKECNHFYINLDIKIKKSIANNEMTSHYNESNKIHEQSSNFKPN